MMARPTPISSAKKSAIVVRRRVYFGWSMPSDWNPLATPWRRCRPTSSVAMT